MFVPVYFSIFVRVSAQSTVVKKYHIHTHTPNPTHDPDQQDKNQTIKTLLILVKSQNRYSLISGYVSHIMFEYLIALLLIFCADIFLIVLYLT